ncbi:MAG: molecular chaperone Hsp33 [Akkermansiaceae bacterium]|jgi:molecular chaperone Hsp33
MQEPVAEFTKVESIFVRHRNCLMVRAGFTPIFTDYYLHLMDVEQRHPENLDTTLKDLLAVLTLHLTARPWAETIAWTANLRAPRVNFFATGSSTQEYIIGRLFTEDVREPDRNFLYSQTTTPGSQPHNSTIEVESTDPIEWIQHFYEQSEQRPGRVFRLPDDTYVLIAAQPDYDEEWLTNLTTGDVAKITDEEETQTLETRKFKFACGCSLERILPTLSAWKDKPEELFGDDATLNLQCPRCAKKYLITREDLG